jgi:group I intron endonuclease
MYIYKTTNIQNNLVYIGQTIRDLHVTEKYLGSGRLLKEAILEYGIENFKKEILEYCPTLEILNEREIFWINYYNSTNKNVGYNLSKGGTNANLSPFIKESLNTVEAKISATSRNKKKWEDSEYRKKVTDSNISTWSSTDKLKEHSNILKEKWKSKEIRERHKNAMNHMEIVKCPHCQTTGKLNIMNGRHFENCVNHTDSIKRKIAIERWESIKNSTKKVQCPHCKKIGTVGNMNRWHFDNCKTLNC